MSSYRATIYLFVVLFILLALVTGCLVVPAPGWDADVLYKDDFSTRSGGWNQVRDENGITDFEQGGYRIQVLQSNAQFWSHPRLDVGDVVLEVDVQTLGGPDENLFGLICRYQDEKNFYFFLVGNDGFFVVGKYKNGAQSFIGMDTFGFHEAIQKGNDAANLLRASCVQDQLTLYVNESQIVAVRENDFQTGDVGLIAGTLDDPGTDVLFDNFIVRKP